MKQRPVLLLSRALDCGGSERQLTEMAKALDRSRWQPHVGCFDDSGIRAKELRDAGIPVVRIPVRSFLSWSVVSGGVCLRNYIRDHNIVLAHSFDPPANIFGAPTARFAGCPAVLSSQRSHRNLRSTSGRRMLRLTDRIVDGIVVNCEAVKRHLIEDENIPAGRIHVCYNGIDTRMFYPDPGSPRPPAVAGAPLTIGTVCVLRPEKSVVTLLQAFAKVRALNPLARLVVVGSGPAAAGLRQTASELMLHDCCVFEPATHDVAMWLRAIDIFVLPSLSEALSNSLMEAMACGCCPVASDTGGNPELIRHGETGFLFPAGDAGQLAAHLTLLMQSEELRRGLAARAGEILRSRFSVSAAVARLEAIYDDILSKTTYQR